MMIIFLQKYPDAIKVSDVIHTIPAPNLSLNNGQPIPNLLKDYQKPKYNEHPVISSFL